MSLQVFGISGVRQSMVWSLVWRHSSSSLTWLLVYFTLKGYIIIISGCTREMYNLFKILAIGIIVIKARISFQLVITMPLFQHAGVLAAWYLVCSQTPLWAHSELSSCIYGTTPGEVLRWRTLNSSNLEEDGNRRYSRSLVILQVMHDICINKQSKQLSIMLPSIKVFALPCVSIIVT